MGNVGLIGGCLVKMGQVQRANHRGGHRHHGDPLFGKKTPEEIQERGGVLTNTFNLFPAILPTCWLQYSAPYSQQQEKQRHHSQ